MRIIITRPIDDALGLQAKLKARGYEGLLCPLLAIQAMAGVNIPQKNFQALCATSANAFKFFTPTPAQLNLPVFTLGPQSQQAAQQKGFHTIYAEGGTVAGLSRYIHENLHPIHGPLLYISGVEISGDLKGSLEAVGFAVDKIITYQAVPQTPANLADMLSSAQAVLLYSPRTAQLWLDAMHRLNSLEPAARLHYVCLSQAVAEKLPKTWHKTIAPHPHEASLLEQLDCAEGKR